MHNKFCLESPKGRGHSEDLGVDDRIIIFVVGTRIPSVSAIEW
jgi:hypothetical protein